jgi:thiol-disulfide isomerase/thioredoxin
LKYIEFLINRVVRGRKPWSVASDIVFFGLILMLLIPTTRRLLLSGVATARTWITCTGGSAGQKPSLASDSWNWRYTDGLGRISAFGSLRGEVIFLNQWATWCPPCSAEMPSVERLFRDYGTRVKFVMLTGEDPEKVKQYLLKQGYTFPVSFGSVAGSDLLSRSIPATAIINRAGEMVISRKGAMNWNARKIRKLLDQAIEEGKIPGGQ